MAKTVAQKKQPETANKQKKKKRPQRSWRQTLIIGIMLLALAGMILPSIISNFSGGNSARNFIPNRTENMPDPKFTKEGTLSFVSGQTGQVIKTIDIEKADNEMERQFGLMYRRTMEDDQGMLFLFDKPEQQGFWMKNTIIPLDIMFVDENKQILNIHENTKPMSEASLPSKGDARYVVEVIGGFSKKYGVKPGDKINWQ
jgi:uncharacterized membrane protein (UPF0127 family)